MNTRTTRRILITGASQGIGRATALQLAGPEFELLLAARRRDRLEAVATLVRERHGNATVVPMDLGSDASVTSGIEKLLASGPIDVVVNNAGVSHQRTFLQSRVEDRDEEWRVNFFGAVRVIGAVLPAMVERGQGRIINVSSLLGVCAAPTTANYSASKAALESFSQALEGEVSQDGVSIEVFVAPHTQTEMGRRVAMDGVVSLPVDYVAHRLVRAIKRKKRRHYGSPVYRVFSALVRMTPRFMEAQMAKSTRGFMQAARGAGAPTAGCETPR